MFQKKSLGVLALFTAAAALIWMGRPILAKAAPTDGQGNPQTRHTALLKGSGGEISFSVLDLSHAIVSPRDSTSGLPTGKRQHKPFTLTKLLDKASPILLEGLIKGEPFSLEVTTYRRMGGRSIPVVTARLETAFVASVGPQGSADDRPTEEVAFYYNKIAFSYAQTGTTLEDSWAGEYP